MHDSLIAVAVLSGILLVVVFLGLRFALAVGRAQDRRRDAYAEAERQRERLLAVLRSAPDGLLVLDERDRVLMANQRAASLWALMEGEIKGLPVAALSDRGALRKDGEPWRIGDFVVGGGADSSKPVEVTTADSGVALEVSTSPVTGPRGEGRIGTIVLLRDMTARKELEVMRQNLTDMMVHDLRTPLGGIYSSLLALSSDDAMDTDARQGIMGVATRSAERMVRMVETLVDISRMEAGKMPLERSPLHVKSVVEEVVAEMKPQADAKMQDLVVAVEDEDLQVWADRKLVERVLFNLLVNAIKFTPKAGQVRVEARGEGGGGVRIAVEDTGPGIPAADRARIFDRFSQAGQRHQWGSGLGLAFCKLAVEAHGGRIWVESTMDQGSEFIFTLPPT